MGRGAWKIVCQVFRLFALLNVIWSLKFENCQVFRLFAVLNKMQNNHRDGLFHLLRWKACLLNKFPILKVIFFLHFHNQEGMVHTNYCIGCFKRLTHCLDHIMVDGTLSTHLLWSESLHILAIFNAAVCLARVAVIAIITIIINIQYHHQYSISSSSLSSRSCSS